ncbi:carbohydrate esterase family 4 protein [Hysterangium stoloniferum]|nr:carbohydrate esterase family 4 protein [Hysterangium stoloniferum]
MGNRVKVLVLLSLIVNVLALPYDAIGHAHDTRPVPRSLPRSWSHSASHPVHSLFKRSAAPTPGSPEWRSQYPNVNQPPIPEDTIPQAWLSALQAAEQKGLIPSITIPVAIPNQNPQYATGDDPAGPTICSSSWGCRQPDDEWDAPDGHLAIGFDDGPSEGSPLLYPFLQQHNIQATHFMIGYNILNGYDMFHEAYAILQSFLVHTWTHPYMTTLSNVQIVAQLGWTLQIISDSTGGRVPRYWRPPYGDSDNRVRAIAKQVFKLTQINWNHDSEDWTMATNATSLQQVEAAISGWYAGPKTPGLVILEHELTPSTAQAFIDTFPGIASNNWKTGSTVQLFGMPYQNGQIGASQPPAVGAKTPGPSGDNELATVTSTQSAISTVHNSSFVSASSTSTRTTPSIVVTSSSSTPSPTQTGTSSSASSRVASTLVPFLLAGVAILVAGL